MRALFCDALFEYAGDQRTVLLTGDLGFMAFEKLRGAFGPRFINAGIAEQNMVTVAAALAAQGLSPWVYSIASFCCARPFEQIRNDISFHRLPVKLVGNGGGFGYGVQGPTHHAIEDYGVLLTLDHFEAFIPAFDLDVSVVVNRAAKSALASYLRLGRDESPPNWLPPPYAPWRRIIDGPGAAIIAVGPIAGSLIEPLLGADPEGRPSLWAVTELPIVPANIPTSLLKALDDGPGIAIVEEHVRQGSVASSIALAFAELGIHPRTFLSFTAAQHTFETYGSQVYLRKQCGLDPQSVLKALAR